MPKPYPDPIINGTADLFTYTNTVTKGWMTPLFMIACASVLFLLMKAKFYKSSQAAALAFSLTTLLGSFLWVMGALNVEILMFFVVGTVGSVLWASLDS